MPRERKTNNIPKQVSLATRMSISREFVEHFRLCANKCRYKNTRIAAVIRRKLCVERIGTNVDEWEINIVVE